MLDVVKLKISLGLQFLVFFKSLKNIKKKGKNLGPMSCNGYAIYATKIGQAGQSTPLVLFWSGIEVFQLTKTIRVGHHQV